MAIIELSPSPRACCDLSGFGVPRNCMRNEDPNGIKKPLKSCQGSHGLDLCDSGRALGNVEKTMDRNNVQICRTNVEFVQTSIF